MLHGQCESDAYRIAVQITSRSRKKAANRTQSGDSKSKYQHSALSGYCCEWTIRQLAYCRHCRNSCSSHHAILRVAMSFFTTADVGSAKYCLIDESSEKVAGTPIMMQRRRSGESCPVHVNRTSSIRWNISTAWTLITWIKNVKTRFNEIILKTVKTLNKNVFCNKYSDQLTNYKTVSYMAV